MLLVLHFTPYQQKHYIKDLIKNNSPETLGFTGRFWNIPLLKQLVQKECRLAYRESSLQSIMKANILFSSGMGLPGIEAK